MSRAVPTGVLGVNLAPKQNTCRNLKVTDGILALIEDSVKVDIFFSFF